MNIVIVEDSELVSSQIRRVLGKEPRIHVIGVAAEETTALELILSTRPDAVLLDLHLSSGSGMAVLRKMREANIGSRVFVLTNATEDAMRQHCEALGISGFYDKSEVADECFNKLCELLPALPANEDGRLQALYDTRLLDFSHPEEFDALARLARDVTDTAIALVSLVDKDRLWFLSRQGFENRETSRSIAICAHTIQGVDLLEIPDMSLDARFTDNPWVTGAPNIRFYAGVPLIVPSGQALGTLCVLDTVTRTLTDKQSSALKTLANSVVAEIELRSKTMGLTLEADRRKAAEAQVRDLATKDLLTQLPNRMALLDRLGQQVRQSARNGTQFAILVINMDRFKLINDGLGHEAGDQALVEIAQRLTGTLRVTDTVARMGGDEFAAVLGDIGDISDALALADKVNLALRQTTLLRGTELHYDASIGIAVYPDHADDVDDLVRKADLAMQLAKREGGGCSVLFTQAMEVNYSKLLVLEIELEQALKNDAIIAYYQPQIALDGKGISGVEALARWQHPALGLLGPGEFIPFAESRPLIHLIGLRMMDLAIAQLAQWDAQGLRIPVVAVNISQSEIKPALVKAVQTALARHNMAANRFEIEITESVLAPDHTETIAVLKQLRAMGVRITVDDFGSGYSSLGQVRTLPIDGLKIDRSFVTHIPGSETDHVIILAIVQMARSLGLTVVAEGAERLDQLSHLRSMGCDSVQGYVHTQPLSPQDFWQWSKAFVQQSSSRRTRPRIAVLEDDPDMSALIYAMLGSLGCTTDTYGSGLALLESPMTRAYDFAILDLSLPDIDFFELVGKAAEKLGQVPLLLTSGHSASVLEAASLFACEQGLNVKGVLTKPFTAKALSEALGMAC